MLRLLPALFLPTAALAHDATLPHHHPHGIEAGWIAGAAVLALAAAALWWRARR